MMFAPNFYRSIILICISLLSCNALADMHFTLGPNQPEDDKEAQLAGEIAEFLAAYEVAYNNQDYKAVKSMWHADGNPIYMAEEVPFPLYGQDRIDNYFNPRPGKRILDGIDNKYSKVRAKYIAPGIAVATYRLDYDIKLVGMPAMHGWDRAMAVFIRTDEGWKITAYTEAPMGPATMVRKMMKAVPASTEQEKADRGVTLSTIKSLSQAGVSPEFDEFLEARRDIEPTH
jgi:ketosteroid isomerase-like protein